MIGVAQKERGSVDKDSGYEDDRVCQGLSNFGIFNLICVLSFDSDVGDLLINRAQEKRLALKYALESIHNCFEQEIIATLGLKEASAQAIAEDFYTRIKFHRFFAWDFDFDKSDAFFNTVAALFFSGCFSDEFWSTLIIHYFMEIDDLEKYVKLTKIICVSELDLVKVSKVFSLKDFEELPLKPQGRVAEMIRNFATKTPLSG